MKVWLLTDGEPLFFEQGQRCHRTGSLARQLAKAGHETVWWTSRMDHTSKVYNEHYNDIHNVSKNLKTFFLKSSGYKKNMSLSRILHARSISSEFFKRSNVEIKPDIIVAAMPSPEFCLAGYKYAKLNNVPFVIDIRDPWPDIFSGYFSPRIKFIIYPLIYYYRQMIRKIAKGASGIMAVSQSQLDWGLLYAQREFNNNRDKLLYIGHENNNRSRSIKKIKKFSSKEPMKCMYITSWGSSYDAETLIKTAKILDKKVGQKIKIIATGSGDKKLSKIKGYKKLKNIIFTGFISSKKMDEYLNNAHIGLILMKGGITRYWIGNKIGEYISASLAIINNVETEVAQVIEANCVGLNVPSNNPEATANALIKCLISPEKTSSFMNNSNNLFDTSFNRVENTKNYIAHLEKLCKN
ncbi:glycosyltransferase [Alphaproteobacteria bacterium]|nr:glycosyltransferase [Alphaproteobacteria bacterium]